MVSASIEEFSISGMGSVFISIVVSPKKRFWSKIGRRRKEKGSTGGRIVRWDVKEGWKETGTPVEAPSNHSFSMEVNDICLRSSSSFAISPPPTLLYCIQLLPLSYSKNFRLLARTINTSLSQFFSHPLPTYIFISTLVPCSFYPISSSPSLLRSFPPLCILSLPPSFSLFLPLLPQFSSIASKIYSKTQCVKEEELCLSPRAGIKSPLKG